MVRVFGFGAVEVDMVYGWVFVQETLKVVRFDGVFDDIGIETALANAALHDIPEGDMILGENLKSIRISRFSRDIEEITDNSPKSIPRMGVVFIGF